MKQVLDFLTDNKVYYLATVDGDQPRVRPLGFVMEWEGKLAFCTSNDKPMYRQIAQNPKVEISCVNADMVTLRLTGTVRFITTPQSQQKALEVMPALGKIYAVGDGRFEIFCLESGAATLSTMTGDVTPLAL